MSASAAPVMSGQSRVQTLFAGLTQLLRSYQLYGPNGAPNARLLGNVAAQFEALWTVLPELEITVTDRQLRLGDAAVYEADPTSESLPFCLYRDSIRTLTFLPGFETSELEAFIEVLHTARQRSESDDLLTMLWERDFGYLRYAYVDLHAGEEQEPGGGIPGAGTAARTVAAHMGRGAAPDESGADARLELDGLDGAGDLPANSGTSAYVDPEGLAQGIAGNAGRRELSLGPDEVAYLRAELDLELARDVVLDVVNALLDTLEEPVPRLQSQGLRNLERLLPQLVAPQRLPAAAWAVDEILRLAAAPDAAVAPLAAELRRLARDFVLAMFEGEAFARLKDAAEKHPDALRGLLVHCGGEALEALVGWGLQARGGTRDIVRAATSACAAKNPAAILALLAHPESAVCRAALELAVQTPDARGVPQVVALLQHEDAAVRTAAIQALTTLGGPAALDALVAALRQEASDVRAAAAWGLGVWGHKPAAQPLLDILESKPFASAPLPEKIALFDAYARVRGPDATEWLAGVLKAGFRLGRRPAPETRACAARALATVGTPAALAALEAARGDKEPAVRTAVHRALERMP